jgi:hypothetical protein
MQSPHDSFLRLTVGACPCFPYHLVYGSKERPLSEGGFSWFPLRRLEGQGISTTYQSRRTGRPPYQIACLSLGLTLPERLSHGLHGVL